MFLVSHQEGAQLPDCCEGAFKQMVSPSVAFATLLRGNFQEFAVEFGVLQPWWKRADFPVSSLQTVSLGLSGLVVHCVGIMVRQRAYLGEGGGGERLPEAGEALWMLLQEFLFY